MNRECPEKSCKTLSRSVKIGSYYRKSDSKRVQKYKCINCGRYFSSASFSVNYYQKRRRLNPLIYKLLVSGNSQRRIARLLGCNLKTVARKFIFLSEQMRAKHMDYVLKHRNIQSIQFDEMETWEHSKLKPLSIFVLVEKDSRKILSIKVSQMPAKGLIRDRSLKKYGKRQDHRKWDMEEEFSFLQGILSPSASFESDESPRYPSLVKKYFPDSFHKRYKGRRGCVTGQGELKAGGFDPLFSINHSCAMLRANVNRLVRRTWCTTKIKENLQRHIDLYMYYHNTQLI
ncbi:MAG: hypothetical protein KDD37_05970 [Bdellovibrionales bacterium]|nr:hypothetical protein [Bdellovibrionales bacterium]